MKDQVEVDWGRIHARPGMYSCPVHGLVGPRRQVVPACPDCGRIAHLAVAGPAGTVVWQEPVPATCAGPDRHRLKAGAYSIGSASCSCTPAGVHRSWTCRRCGDVQQWPPHSVVDADPYFGPGAR